jgi:cell division protein FtsL
MTLIYDYNNLQTRENKLQKYNNMLKLELASIVSYEKVERIAKEKMKMIVPEDENIVLVRVQD